MESTTVGLEPDQEYALLLIEPLPVFAEIPEVNAFPPFVVEIAVIFFPSGTERVIVYPLYARKSPVFKYPFVDVPLETAIDTLFELPFKENSLALIPDMLPE